MDINGGTVVLVIVGLVLYKFIDLLASKWFKVLNANDYVTKLEWESKCKECAVEKSKSTEERTKHDDDFKKEMREGIGNITKFLLVVATKLNIAPEDIASLIIKDKQN